MHRILVAALVVGLVAGCLPASAALVDLTYHNMSGNIGVVWFLEFDVAKTGSGVFGPFVRFQNNGVEYAYNENLGDGAASDNPYLSGGAGFNYTIQWSQVPLILHPTDNNGDPFLNGWYAEFTLDLNQSGQVYISIDEVEIWLSDDPNLGATGKEHATWGSLGPNTVMIYSFAGADGVALNGDLEPGSGGGDVGMYVPWELFEAYRLSTGVSDPYVYIYTEMGGYSGTQIVRDKNNNPVSNSNWGANDGFEEWALRAGGSHPYLPEPGTTTLLILGLGSLGAVIRKRRQA